METTYRVLIQQKWEKFAGTVDNIKDTEQKSSNEELDIALKECGFGLFHVMLLLASLIGFIAGTSVSNTTPYILPIAECDLDMNLLEKGFLNAIPFVGQTRTTRCGASRGSNAGPYDDVYPYFANKGHGYVTF
ncbi:unnamed protein product, partial [Iphiclides podalirius]